MHYVAAAAYMTEGAFSSRTLVAREIGCGCSEMAYESLREKPLGCILEQFHRAFLLVVKPSSALREAVGGFWMGIFQQVSRQVQVKTPKIAPERAPAFGRAVCRLPQAPPPRKSSHR